MAVAPDAVGGAGFTAATFFSASSIITVGSGANRALIFVIFFNATVSGVSATWDSGGTNQAMTSLGSATSGGNTAFFFGLVAPTSGSLTINATWTGTSDGFYGLTSFTGVNQTGGVTSFPHFTTNSGTSATSSVTVTSAVGDMAVAAHFNSLQTYDTPSGTTVTNDVASGLGGVVNQDNGASTVTLTAPVTGGNSVAWQSLGIDIAAAPTVIPVGLNPEDQVLWPVHPVRLARPLTNMGTNLALYFQALSSVKRVTYLTPPFHPRPTGPDASAGLNIALTTIAGPPPIRPSDWSHPFDIPSVPSLPPQQNYANFYPNPIPFSQLQWPNTQKPPPAKEPPTWSLNIQLFTNPLPFAQYDWSKPWRVESVLDLTTEDTPLTLFANLGPFSQYDWSKPVRVPSVPPFQPQPNYLEFYPNPIPFAQYDWSKPLPVPVRPHPRVEGININLLTSPVAPPFLPLDYSKPFFPRNQIDATAPTNINLFTNPIPFAVVDFSHVFDVPSVPQAPLPTPLVLSANLGPWTQVDFFKPQPFALAQPAPPPANLSLLSPPISAPFVPVNWGLAFKVASVPAPTNMGSNPLLFTNPIPFGFVPSNFTPAALFVRMPPAQYQASLPLYHPPVVVTGTEHNAYFLNISFGKLSGM